MIIISQHKQRYINFENIFGLTVHVDEFGMFEVRTMTEDISKYRIHIRRI